MRLRHGVLRCGWRLRASAGSALAQGALRQVHGPRAASGGPGTSVGVEWAVEDIRLVLLPPQPGSCALGGKRLVANLLVRLVLCSARPLFARRLLNSPAEPMLSVSSTRAGRPRRQTCSGPDTQNLNLSALLP